MQQELMNIMNTIRLFNKYMLRRMRLDNTFNMNFLFIICHQTN